MASELHHMFVETVSALFYARLSVRDLFFNRRLSDGISEILAAYAQYSLHKENFRPYLRALKDIEALLEEIAYDHNEGAIALGVARERVLFCIREIIHQARSLERKEASIVPPSPAQSAVHESKARRPQGAQPDSTKEKILEFVRNGPERRPKDVIDQFSALSERTVKRGLKELSQEGRIVKKSENRAVYYSVAPRKP